MKSKVNNLCATVTVACVAFAILAALPLVLKFVFVTALVVNFFTGETE